MGIDFYKKGSSGERALFQPTDNLYADLQAVFDEYRKKTGIFVDPYGRVTLVPENAKLIKDILLALVSQKLLVYNKSFDSFLNFLDEVYNRDIVVLATGD